MTYKEYYARIVFDDHDRLFHGEVLGIRDVVTFHGRSVRELERAFKDSVEDYLAWCRERGEEADRPFSGKFVIRIDPDIHRRLVTEAGMKDESLNTLVARILCAHVQPERRNHKDSKTPRKTRRLV